MSRWHKGDFESSVKGKWLLAVKCEASDLCEHQILWAAAIQTQDKADRLEKLLDAGSELLLLHPAGGSWVQDTRLDDELEQIL